MRVYDRMARDLKVYQSLHRARRRTQGASIQRDNEGGERALAAHQDDLQRQLADAYRAGVLAERRRLAGEHDEAIVAGWVLAHYRPGKA